jgi:hypothetical protein
MKTIQELISKLEELGHKIYRNPFELNIVFIRTNERFTNKFDDEAYWFWWNDRNEIGFKIARCTTKAGFYYVTNFLNKEGTAILKEVQYLDSYKKGLHNGQYSALIQSKPISVWRDKDGDIEIDIDKEAIGYFGINVHRANKDRESLIVNNWSAACMVFSNPIMFKSFMRAVDQQLDLTKRTLFSPTILKAF